jgi:hypothetical protein
MIYAIKEARKRCPFNGYITMWTLDCMLNIYEYYIEAYARAREHADNNFKWCKLYYNEVYKDIEQNISNEILAQHYNEMMKGAYMGNKLEGIIPHINIFEFLEALKQNN